MKNKTKVREFCRQLFIAQFFIPIIESEIKENKLYDKILAQFDFNSKIQNQIFTVNVSMRQNYNSLALRHVV